LAKSTTTAAPTIALSALVESPSNPRQSFDPTALAELAASIKSQGVIEPIIVRALKGKKGKFEIVCGSRRYRAAKAAKLKEIPALTRVLDDREVLQLQVIENQQRQDVHPIEEAAGYAGLRDTHKMAVPDIAKQIGMSVAHVYARLKLDALDGPCRKAFLDNRITAGHAILIARLSPTAQGTVYKKYLFHRDDDAPVSVRALQQSIATRLQHKISKARFKADEAIGKLPLCVECPYNSDNQPGHPDNGKGICGDAACWSAKLDGVVQAKRETAEAEGEPLVAIHDGYWSNDGVIGKQDYEVVRSQDAEAKKAKRAIVVEGDDRGKLAWIVKKGSAAPGAKKPDTPEDIQRKAEERENRAINAARKDALRDISITLYNSDPKVVTGKVQQALMAQLAEGMFHSDFTMVERDAAAARHELVKPDEKGRFKVKQGEGDTLLSRHLKGLEPDQLLGFCVEAIIQRYVKGSPWGQPDRLANVGKLLGVNVKDYEKAALAELKEKTDAKAARAEAKRAKELAQVKAVRAEERAEAKAAAKAKADKGKPRPRHPRSRRRRSPPRASRSPRPRPSSGRGLCPLPWARSPLASAGGLLVYWARRVCTRLQTPALLARCRRWRRRAWGAGPGRHWGRLVAYPGAA
jgi:ParB/RepB/Spo0J family partition protein